MPVLRHGPHLRLIVEDDLGWHESVCGNSNAAQVAERWGARDYQNARNEWHQNGYDASSSSWPNTVWAAPTWPPT
ncbi:hypothetical protein UMZ34_04140 [Halopseudomonas pachastrellae]|nr:hypothetical protein UMZ34_04140 [Halopseudomonas pachastrellae]